MRILIPRHLAAVVFFACLFFVNSFAAAEPRVLIPSISTGNATWRYTVAKPDDGWTKLDEELSIQADPVAAAELQKLRDARWPIAKAWEWYAEVGPISGCNYVPRTAVNTTEMWQKETFEIAWDILLFFSVGGGAKNR